MKVFLQVDFKLIPGKVSRRASVRSRDALDELGSLV
jgi:hypothetical protein